MSSISTKLGISIENLCEWNNRSATKPIVYNGEKLTYYTNSDDSESPKKSVQPKKHSYVVSSGETMGTVAEKLGITVKSLCEWNDKSLKNPTIYRGEKLVYYSNDIQKESSKESPKTSNKSKTYTVKKGDTMYSIARENNLSVTELLKINDIPKERQLREGETLLISGKSKSVSTSKTSKHVIKNGETLWSIANKNGISVKELCKANDIEPSSAIQVGKTLLIPSGE